MLGAVEVVDDGGPVSLGGPQQRKVLAVLLSDPGTTLTYDRLLEVLWPDGQAPENARRTAISYVSRLRSALGEGWVTTSAAGYQLDISSASVDALRFVALVDGARNLPPERAIDVLDEALALWRGPVFGDLHGEWWALPAVSRLDELHLAALADRIDALSAGGWDTRALSEVQALVAAHPLRGPFVERLMRGLQASGRTDEALHAFQQHRNALIERTGLDPSDELIALDRSIASAGQLSIPADSVGRALRGYVLRDVIGEGSFGTVYRATQPHVARDVAVKVVRRELADDRTFIHRFEAEARMVARLEHPHIVPLYDFWREPGGAYLVFRLLRGGTAEQVLVSTGPLDLPSVTRLLEQIGGALGSAHAAGVIHRDVKPANILFDDDGEAYLTDFGIATAAVEDDPSPSSESPRPYGRRSAGSPMYASPEQARDGFADARADQYALAATVWELLTGQPPFEGATAAEVIKAKLDSPLAPVRLLRPDVPARLEEVLARASAIHPDDRFATVAEFVASWQSALAVSLTTTTAPPEASTDGRSGERLGATALTMSGLVVNPFKGLRPFGEADAADFFGRDQIVGELHQLVNEQRFTAVVGPSGSGKSSLVLAGLVPELKRGGFLVCRFTPGADPFDAFSAALIDLATVDQARDLSPDLLRREGGLVVAVDALAADDGLVIVIDQLEELWTTTDDDERTLFAASLADLHRASSCARVVATVRADWFDRPLRDPSLGPLVARATFGITPMEASELHTRDQRACGARRRSFRRRSRRPNGDRGSRPTGVAATVAVRPRRTLRPPFGRHDHHRGVRPDRRPVRLRRPSGRIAVRQLHVAGPVGGAPALRPPRDSRRRCRGHPPKGPSERAGRRRRPGGQRAGRSTPPHRWIATASHANPPSRSPTRHSCADGPDYASGSTRTATGCANYARWRVPPASGSRAVATRQTSIAARDSR